MNHVCGDDPKERICCACCKDCKCAECVKSLPDKESATDKPCPTAEPCCDACCCGPEPRCRCRASRADPEEELQARRKEAALSMAKDAPGKLELFEVPKVTGYAVVGEKTL